MPRFALIPANEWRLSSEISSARRSWLLDTRFEIIINRLIAEMRLIKCKSDRIGVCPTARRVIVTLSVSRKTVDMFHNGAGGYRAQFYQSISCGERANKYVVQKIKEKAIALCQRAPIRSCPREFVSASLNEVDTKVWIHQGIWLRAKRRKDRNLSVARWQRNERSLPSRKKKLALWATLTPASETQIEIKGGAVNKKTYVPMGLRLKPKRSRELTKFGFT